MASEPFPNVIVVDANVLIAAVRPDIGQTTAEEGSASVRLFTAIDDGRLRGYVPAVVLSEVVHVLGRAGIPQRPRSALVARWLMMADRLMFVPVDAELAVEGGNYRQTHYHRERLPLSYADCFCVALAQRLAAPLLTLDKPLLRAPDCVVTSPVEYLASRGF